MIDAFHLGFEDFASLSILIDHDATGDAAGDAAGDATDGCQLSGIWPFRTGLLK